MPRHPFSGIHPTKHCLARLKSAPAELARLLKCKSAPQGLKDAAIVEHPQQIDSLKKSVASAAAWELQHYGCLLIEDVTPWNAEGAHAASA